ncbi:MAG: hypothetical protein KDI51_01495, partial [Xanthomonadales bacterium]|nr:hypothetical protein [Xanthomonadales bacterium]
VAWYQNCGGQFLLDGAALSTAHAINPGDPVLLLTLDYLHNGRAGDAAAVLASLPLQFTDGADNPLNTAQANALIDQVRVYRDNGDLNFNPANDPIVGMLDSLALTPVALSNATQVVDLDLSGGVSVSAIGSARLFVEVLTTIDAASANPGRFQISAPQIPTPRPQAMDAQSAAVLSLECPLNASSGVVSFAGLTPVNLSVSATSGSEAGATAITVTATLDSAVAENQSVNLQTSGSATLGSDYSLSSSQISIPAGATSGSVTLTIINDAVLEGPETATLTLTNPSALLSLGSSITQSVTITDDDSASLSINDVSVNEGAGLVTFTVTLSNAVQAGTSVDFASSDGTAVAGSDYTATSGTLTFPGAAGTQTVNVTITDDALVESDEVFTVILSGPTNGVDLARAIGTATIIDNDTAGGDEIYANGFENP